MLTFIVPLRARATTDDWPMVCQLFENTLASIFGQTDPDFRVLVLCHDRPTLRRRYDDRLEYLEVDLPIPSKKLGVSTMDDKWAKLATGLLHLSHSPPHYTMFVDADDLVSRHLVAYVKADADPNGYIIKDGYCYFASHTWLRHLSRTYDCGTNSILNTSQLEFPKSLSGPDRARCIALRWGHTKIEAKMKERGTPLKPLPFPGGIYVLHLEQDSAPCRGILPTRTRKTLHNHFGSVKRFLKVAHQYRPYTQGIEKDFGVGPDDYLRPRLDPRELS
jgi:hypothetical protein